MNLTDNEIIKGLECCTQKVGCSGCPFLNSLENKYRGGYACAEEMRKSALDLIKRKDKALKLATKEVVDLKIKVKQQKVDIDRLALDVHSITKERDALFDMVEEQKAEVEKFEKIDHFAQKTIVLQTAEIKKLEAEVERLKLAAQPYLDEIAREIGLMDDDKTYVIEMVGEEE